VKQVYITLIFTFILTSCHQASDGDTASAAKKYFEIYSERQNFEAFMAYYADNAVLEDIVSGLTFNNKQEIRTFLDWHKGDFIMPDSGQLFSINKQIVQNNTVVTQGEFHAFNYNGRDLGPWAFVIVQEFNQQQRIVKQSDWINYHEE